MTVEYNVDNEFESKVYNMRLRGTNADSIYAEVDFTLTIVRNCASATVIAPTSISDYNYKINSGLVTKSLAKFKSSDVYCEPYLTYEVQLAAGSVALSTSWSTTDYVYKLI
jgi:hypothetical protein